MKVRNASNFIYPVCSKIIRMYWCNSKNKYQIRICQNKLGLSLYPMRTKIQKNYFNSFFNKIRVSEAKIMILKIIPVKNKNMKNLCIVYFNFSKYNVLVLHTYRCLYIEKHIQTHYKKPSFLMINF